MRNLLRHIRKQKFPYIPLVEVTIFKDHILHNLNEFKKQNPGVTIAPVLKSNAYGHGLIEVARILDNQDISFLVVDSYFEAITLRNEGIQKPILIIGYTLPQNILASDLSNVSFTITDIEQLREVSNSLKNKIPFHLKIDTGLSRQGLSINELDEAFGLIDSNKKIVLEGICSHLADADTPSSKKTAEQITTWEGVISKTLARFTNLKHWHLSNSAGHFYRKNIRANMMRLGLGLYGIHPSSLLNGMDLKPALEMKSIVSGTKTIKKGDTVGYCGTFKTPYDARIATIPVGYCEGIDRRLSNTGRVKIGDEFFPIIGRVSMNITTIDISNFPHIKAGSPVTLISSNPKDTNSIQKISDHIEVIPHELLVHIPQHLRRTVQ